MEQRYCQGGVKTLVCCWFLYTALQDLQIPLPGIRTVQRRMQSVRFEPGVLREVFDFLKLKADGFTDLERECVLTLDEMAITPTAWRCDFARSHGGGNTCVCVYVGWKLNTLEASCCIPSRWQFYQWSRVQANNYLSNSEGSIHWATCGNPLGSTTIKHW